MRLSRTLALLPLPLTVLLLPLSAVVSQTAKTKAAAPSASGLPAAYSAIKEADLKHDLYEMAGLPMRGREAGTLDELRASMWVADQLRAIGVKPAGTDGSYFQWWEMRRTRVSTASSSAKIGSRTLELWKDIVPNGNSISEASGMTVFAGDGLDSTIDVRGKVAIVTMSKPTMTRCPSALTAVAMTAVTFTTRPPSRTRWVTPSIQR